MTNLEQMLLKIDEKLKENTFSVLDDNVYCGEMQGKKSLDDDMFPRLEFNYHAEDNYEYVSFPTVGPYHAFSVQGWIRWIKEDENGVPVGEYEQGLPRLLYTARFFRETITNIFKINSDDRDGVGQHIDGFEMVDPLYHAQVYHEMDKKHTSFVFVFRIKASRAWYKLEK